MPRYCKVAENYTRPKNTKWICEKEKCRHYKNDGWKNCKRFVATWQCPRFMGDDCYK